MKKQNKTKEKACQSQILCPMKISLKNDGGNKDILNKNRLLPTLIKDNLNQLHSLEVFVMIEIFFVLFSVVVISYIGLVNFWNVASVTEELSFSKIKLNFNLNAYMHLSAVLKYIHQVEWTPHGQNKRYEGLKKKVMYI